MGLNSTFQINVFCKIFGKAGREGIGSRGDRVGWAGDTTGEKAASDSVCLTMA